MSNRPNNRQHRPPEPAPVYEPPPAYVTDIEGVDYLCEPVSVRDDGHFVVKIRPCTVVDDVAVEDPDGGALESVTVEDVEPMFIIQRNPLVPDVAPGAWGRPEEAEVLGSDNN